MPKSYKLFMQGVWWCRLLDFCGVQWQRHRAMWFWLVGWLLAGIVFGIVTIYVSRVGVDDINYHLIDGNILNTTAGAGLGSFIWQRWLSLILPVVVVFVGAWLSRVTGWVVFPVVFMHGYWLAIAVWWTFFYYSWPVLLVLVFYIGWLLVVTAVLFSGLIGAWQWGTRLRTDGRCAAGTVWGGILRGGLVLSAIAIVMGVFEYLVFWTVLGKIVYKPL